MGNLNRRTMLQSVGAMVLGVAVTKLLAQEDVPPPKVAKPDLSGKWKLNVAKSQYGGGQAPLAASEVISQNGDSFTIAHVEQTANATLKYKLSFRVGEGEKIVPAGAFQRTDVFQVQDTEAKWMSDSLVTSYNATLNKDPLYIVSHYTMLPDKQVLNKVTHVDRDVNPIYIVEIYERD